MLELITFSGKNEIHISTEQSRSKQKCLCGISLMKSHEKHHLNCNAGAVHELKDFQLLLDEEYADKKLCTDCKNVINIKLNSLDKITITCSSELIPVIISSNVLKKVPIEIMFNENQELRKWLSLNINSSFSLKDENLRFEVKESIADYRKIHLGF